MRRNLILLWFLLPIFAYSQVRIDISPDFKHDTSKVSFWYVNGKRVEWQDFPVVITPMKMRLDTVILSKTKMPTAFMTPHSYSFQKIKNDVGSKQ